jgi:hypothetical protein
MNYEIHQDLTVEEAKKKKESLKIPTGFYPFEMDTLDIMQEHENLSVFNMSDPDYHDPHCKRVKHDKSTCCEPLIKNFNQYNQSVYKDQGVELPFSLGNSSTSNGSKTSENLDLVS